MSRSSEISSLLPDPDRLSKIDAGELPAETVQELVSALRQSVSAAGAEASNVVYALNSGKTAEALEAAERLRDRLRAADHKLAIALDKAYDRD
jgi:hypothetical protein